MERLKGLNISMYCDRETTSIPKSQAGFIKFICLPLYESFGNFLNSEQIKTNCVKQVEKNLAEWEVRQKKKYKTSGGNTLLKENNIVIQQDVPNSVKLLSLKGIQQQVSNLDVKLCQSATFEMEKDYDSKVEISSKKSNQKKQQDLFSTQEFEEEKHELQSTTLQMDVSKINENDTNINKNEQNSFEQLNKELQEMESMLNLIEKDSEPPEK